MAKKSLLGLVLSTLLISISAWAQIEVHGHRGARASFPEGTLEAFNYALEVGVDFLELDLRFTADDQIVIHHDPVINRDLCLDRDRMRVSDKLPIASLSLKQVQDFDCGSLPHPDFPLQRRVTGARILSFSELLHMLRESSLPQAKKVGLHIEFKTLAGRKNPGPIEFADRVIGMIQSSGLQNKIVVQSFDPRYTIAAKKKLKEAGILTDDRILSPKSTWLSRILVSALQKLKYRVVPWTANTPEEWDWLIGIGVDGIVTDDPAGLIAYLKERGI